MKRAKAREVEKRATENTRFTSWSLPSIKAHSELIDKLLPSSQPHDMSNFFLVNNTIIQVQGNINHIDCSQTTISLTDCFNVVTATGPSSDQPSPSGLLIFCPCLENITEIELSWLDLSSNDSDSMRFSGTLHMLMGISRVVLTSWSIRHNIGKYYVPRRTIASYGTQFESMRNVLKIHIE